MGAETTRTRRAEQKALRRQEILDAAIEIWATKGSRGAGITEVAERAGMTHAGLLHHFGTKGNLLLAVMEERDRRDRTILQPYFEHGDIDQLWRHYSDVARANEAEPGLAQLFIVLLGENISEGSVGHQYFIDRYKRVRSRTADCLRTAQGAGRIHADVDCDLKAAEIVAFMDGALIQWMMQPEPGRLVRLYEDFFAAMARTIGLELSR